MDEREISRKLEEIETRERALERREKASGIKRNLYEQVTCSKRSVEIVIFVCGVLIAGLTLFGIFGKR